MILCVTKRVDWDEQVPNRRQPVVVPTIFPAIVSDAVFNEAVVVAANNVLGQTIFRVAEAVEPVVGEVVCSCSDRPEYPIDDVDRMLVRITGGEDVVVLEIVIDDGKPVSR